MSKCVHTEREQRLRDIAQQIGELVAQKNSAYGSSFEKAGQFLSLLYPVGLRPEQFNDALLLARIFDKCMRIATRKDAFGESPYRDLSGYGILGATKDESLANGPAEPETGSKDWLRSEHSRICTLLQRCCQEYGIGLPGEDVAEVIVAEIKRLKAES